MAMMQIKTTCCITGGGPAGITLGYLLARAGVSVVVLEKHADFLRDFRGDTIHPSTLEMMHELGLLEEFLKLPHSKVRQLSVQIGDDHLVVGHFEHLPVHCKFIALMPQWDFLNFLAENGKRFGGFDLRMRTEATDLIFDDGKVAGVRAKTAEDQIEIHADLTVACDGRHSTLRERAGFNVENLHAPMDVMWFRISRNDGDPAEVVAHIESGRMLVMLNRNDYWQCAYVIPKGTAEDVEHAGLDKFRNAVEAISFAERAVAITGQRDPIGLDVLAVAYAASGAFDKAIATEREAQLLLPEQNSTAAAAIRDRVVLFQKRLPFVDLHSAASRDK